MTTTDIWVTVMWDDDKDVVRVFAHDAEPTDADLARMQGESDLYFETRRVPLLPVSAE